MSKIGTIPQRHIGICHYCGDVFTKTTIKKHLDRCGKRNELIEKSSDRSQTNQVLLHIHVSDIDKPEFWLNMEVNSDSKLLNLDKYLRAIWLECCGHMSMFSENGWNTPEIKKSKQIGDVFRIYKSITYIYDFGTESRLVIKLIGLREGKALSKKPICLLARNLSPQYKCIRCKNVADWLCMECVIEEEKWGTLCDEHVESHEHKDYGPPFFLVNSPRMGLCGYEGPAEPPYK
jgi:hypothetical protein